MYDAPTQQIAPNITKQILFQNILYFFQALSQNPLPRPNPNIYSTCPAKQISGGQRVEGYGVVHHVQGEHHQTYLLHTTVDAVDD